MDTKKRVLEKIELPSKNSLSLSDLKTFISQFDLYGIADAEAQVFIGDGKLYIEGSRNMTSSELDVKKEQEAFQMVQTLRSYRSTLSSRIKEKQLAIEKIKARLATIKEEKDYIDVDTKLNLKVARLAEYEETISILDKDLLEIDKKSYEEIKDLKVFVSNFLD